MKAGCSREKGPGEGTVNGRRGLLIGPVTVVALVAASAEETMDREKLDVKRRTVVYKTVGDVELEMHGFLPPDWTGDKKLPAIVFFFGGGWRAGSPQQFFPHCAYLASRGMVAAAAEYRVKSRHGTGPVECVKDGKSAVRWMRANAEKLGVDPGRIAAGGGSAGGHMAACTALVPGLEEKGEDGEVSSRPDALVLFNPVVDVAVRAERMGLARKVAESISPVHRVREALPPCIIFHGEEDTTVPIERVRRFCRLMREAENRCNVVGYEGEGHAFFNYNRGEDHAAFRDTVYRADRFLASLGWLEGEPTIEPPEGLRVND